MNAIVIIGGVAIIGFFVYNLIHKTSKSDSSITKLPDKHEELPSNEHVKGIITDYFTKYAKDRGEYELYGFYKRQFDLEDHGYDKKYEKNVDEIGKLYDLGLNEDEIAAGRAIMREMVQKIAQIDTKGFTESKSLIFLLDYHEADGKQRELKQIEDVVKDKERHSQYVEENDDRIRELIEGLA